MPEDTDDPYDYIPDEPMPCDEEVKVSTCWALCENPASYTHTYQTCGCDQAPYVTFLTCDQHVTLVREWAGYRCKECGTFCPLTRVTSYVQKRDRP